MREARFHATDAVAHVATDSPATSIVWFLRLRCERSRPTRPQHRLESAHPPGERTIQVRARWRNGNTQGKFVCPDLKSPRRVRFPLWPSLMSRSGKLTAGQASSGTRMLESYAAVRTINDTSHDPSCCFATQTLRAASGPPGGAFARGTAFSADNAANSARRASTRRTVRR